MFTRRRVGLLLALSLGATPASAQERGQPTYEITFERAIELARRQAPDLATAQARIDEARGAVEVASAWRFNPELEASAGPRLGTAETTTDWSIGARQWLEIGGQRGNRLAAARAKVDAAGARTDDAQRLLVREVGLTFVQALYWDQRLLVAQENSAIADAVARVARRRHEVGDVGALEESVAALFLARAHADETGALAERRHVDGRLKILLGLEPGARIALRGDLRQLGMPASATPPVDVDTRPDLRALSAEIRHAEAEADLGRAARVPNIALGADYAQEDREDIIHGSVALALPLFDHGQGRTAVAQARRTRIETELRGVRRRATIEVEIARENSERLSAAARQFEERGLPALRHSERIATASYEAGAIPLGELLAIRREFVQAKLDYAGMLLRAATARVELTAATGGSR